jgi:hypothetical protein
MATIEEQIQDWTNETMYNISKTPEEVRADKTRDLFQKYIEAKRVKQSAPSDYENARELYFRSKDGDEAYERGQQREDKKEGRKKAEHFKKRFDQKVHRARKAFAMYSAALKFAANSETDFLKTMEFYMVRIKAEESIAHFNTTSERKTYYLNAEQDTVENWDTVLSLVIVSAGVVYLKNTIIDRKQYKSVMAWAVLLFIWLSNFLLPYLVSWGFHMRKPVNIYTTWADTSHEWHGD